ncbi:MAG: hypothetical protein ACRD1U_14195 [Vicinamibacterales bacterium]
MRTTAVLVCLGLMAVDATAQTLPGGRTAIEAVAAVASSSDRADDPFVWLDFATTVRVNSSLDVIVRPYARRLPGGDWDALLYQAQVRYQPINSLRIDAGIISSPLGLGALELRPDLNPLVSYPFYYFAPLPAFDQFSNQLQLLSGGYPLGAVVSWSGSRWDARGGITDGTPARYRNVLDDGPSPAPQFVAGGGFTPIVGLRFGAGVAAGKYRRSDDDYYRPSYGSMPTDARAVVVNVEAEYSFRYTRLSGEWVRDRFETDGDPVVARGFYLQAVQTLTPRTFAAARWTRASTPFQTPAGLVRRARSAAEVTGGYRLTPQLTLKAGYQASQPYGVSEWSHAAVWSLVWAQRWF